MADERRFALLIACNEYDDPDFKRLKAPQQDAQTLAVASGDHYQSKLGFQFRRITKPLIREKAHVKLFYANNLNNDMF
jgi:hypothetical protein